MAERNYPPRGGNARSQGRNRAGAKAIPAFLVAVVLLGVLIFGLPQLLAGYASVRAENDALQSANRELSANLEAAESEQVEDEEQEAKEDENQRLSTRVIGVDHADVACAVNGDTMDVAVDAWIFNDMRVDIDGTDLPLIVYGDKEYKATLEGSSIRANHGYGKIHWLMEGVPVGALPPFLRWGPSGTIYYSERIVDEINSVVGARLVDYQAQNSGVDGGNQQ
jgi:hypothetical protein